MAGPISPYSASADVPSPDGLYRATIERAEEIAMGSSTYGTLVIVGKHKGANIRHEFDKCNPAMVWSNDSRILSVPQLGHGMILISLPRGESRGVGRSFIQPVLTSFVDGKLEGVDSEGYLTMRFEIDVRDAFGSLHPKTKALYGS